MLLEEAHGAEAAWSASGRFPSHRGHSNSDLPISSPFHQILRHGVRTYHPTTRRRMITSTHRTRRELTTQALYAHCVVSQTWGAFSSLRAPLLAFLEVTQSFHTFSPSH